MREVLFRAKPKREDDYYFFSQAWKDNCKDSLIYGFLVISKDYRYYICVSALCSIKSCVNNGMTSMIEVIPETVGQYTDLTDKNGTKIFEGDILNTTNSNYAIWYVDYKNTAFCCNQGNVNYSCVLDEFIQFSEVEVIGNIHDNSELLK